MKLYRFDNKIGKQVTHFNFIMSRIIKTEKAAQINCMHRG